MLFARGTRDLCACGVGDINQRAHGMPMVKACKTPSREKGKRDGKCLVSTCYDSTTNICIYVIF